MAQLYLLSYVSYNMFSASDLESKFHTLHDSATHKISCGLMALASSSSVYVYRNYKVAKYGHWVGAIFLGRRYQTKLFLDIEF